MENEETFNSIENINRQIDMLVSKNFLRFHGDLVIYIPWIQITNCDYIFFDFISDILVDMKKIWNVVIQYKIIRLDAEDRVSSLIIRKSIT